MVFGFGEFRFHLFSPEPPRKVSGFLSEMSQSFAFLLDLERGGDGGHDLFEARVAAQIIPVWTKLRAFIRKRNAGLESVNSRIEFAAALLVGFTDATLNRSQQPSMTVGQTEIETATVPSAPLPPAQRLRRGRQGRRQARLQRKLVVCRAVC